MLESHDVPPYALHVLHEGLVRNTYTGSDLVTRTVTACPKARGASSLSDGRVSHEANMIMIPVSSASIKKSYMREQSRFRFNCRLPFYLATCQCPCPSSSLFSGSSLIMVSILIIATQASTALLSCLILLMLGSNTPIFTLSTTRPLLKSSP